MSVLKLPVSLMAVLAAGCVAAPEPVVREAGDEAADNRVLAAAAAAAPATEPAVVELRATDPDPKAAEVICREMLQGFSNVIVTRCMTARDWEIFRRAQERQAEEILRAMRGHL